MMNIRPETRELFKKIFKVLAPPPNMTLSEWADKYRYLSPEAAARPGAVAYREYPVFAGNHGRDFRHSG